MYEITFGNGSATMARDDWLVAVFDAVEMAKQRGTYLVSVRDLDAVRKLNTSPPDGPHGPKWWDSALAALRWGWISLDPLT